MGGIITGVGGLIIGVASGITAKISADKKARLSSIKENDARKKLEALERSRQAVIDQSGAIRDLKNQVSNPYENLAVATQAAELKIEQTDQALANTLDQINQSGTGAGAATAMARMAAASKAQVGASLENQEVQNNQLRAQGQAAADQQKMQLEQAALGAEVAAFDRQESRDLASLDRLAGLQENAQAQTMAYQQQGNQALVGGVSQGLSSLTTGLEAEYGK
tara:strand:+ start:3480 stop:4145 length:666 start_codon:yes stop_codon:yes gene_type:complete